jgi:hypothetical protein
MLTFINTIAGRIAIGAALAALVLVLIAFLSFRLQEAEAKIAARDATIAQAITANASLVASNQALVRQSVKDGQALAARDVARQQAADDANDRRDRINQIAQDNPDVASFLDMPIPAALRVPDAPRGDADGDGPDSGK